MLKKFLIKTTHQKLLAFLAENPGQLLHERELVRKTRLAAGSVNKALNDLYEADVLSREKRGRTYLYTLKQDKPDVRSFKVLLVLWRLDRLINALRDTARQVILYGSAAVGLHDERSDVDLLIVAPTRQDVEVIVRKHQNQLRREGMNLQPVIKTTLEWARLEQEDSAYFREVLSGLVLWERPHAEQ